MNPCANPTSSNCVTNQGTRKDLYKNQTEINDHLLQEVDDINAAIDTSTLNTEGTSVNSSFGLINVIQFLLDESKKDNTINVNVTSDNINVSIDLKNLSGNCNTSSYTLTYILQLLVSEISSLRTQIKTINDKLV